MITERGQVQRRQQREVLFDGMQVGVIVDRHQLRVAVAPQEAAAFGEIEAQTDARAGQARDNGAAPLIGGLTTRS